MLRINKKMILFFNEIFFLILLICCYFQYITVYNRLHWGVNHQISQCISQPYLAIKNFGEVQVVLDIRYKKKSKSKIRSISAFSSTVKKKGYPEKSCQKKAIETLKKLKKFARMARKN